MNQGSTHCYRARVHTTNSSGDSFTMNDEYFDAEGGLVYVLADSIEEAAKLIPCAIAIEWAGFALKTAA